MDKLELKDIAPYLPHSLGVKILNHLNDYTGKEFSEINGYYFIGESLHITYNGGNTGKSISEFKPLLRPMSDLTKEITHNGETFIPLHRILEAYCFDLAKMDEEYILSFKESLIEVDMSYKTAQMLHEMHFDTEKLIERGLAINLNEVDNGS
ncbi:hypothetical protein HZP25_15855 [Elizabethkingia anophelis]|nr:hypothetical protein [Elizabethkingia anophelis]